ncbi:DUF599 domain-containing protein [Loktanella sp. M215]|uniref:DUF599 domain-containing protein n=1 Tax=Loktanella sp. M215 TaxID=2675431 RepID=UPI001F396685|nr:DUF599 domain-containing protein [Loktanella sp. M215]MCF7699133.1 DUF599 family protein [Loktanella sp. M215]
MTAMTHLSALGALDIIALTLIIGAWLILGWLIEHPRPHRPSVTVLVAQRRRDWMKVFVTRDPRIFDSQILSSLRQGTSFFASTSIFAIGGVLALIGNTDPLRGVAAEVMVVETPALIWQIKLGLVTLFLVTAFLKFVWSNRVFGYCSVVMAAVPQDPDHPDAYPLAAQAGELNVRAAMNFNRGLRAMYFALGALAWLIGAWAMILATLIVGWTIWSREFASLPRRILLGEVV